MKESLTLFKNQFINELESINGSYDSFTFNTSDLPDIVEFTFNQDIRKHPVFESLFDKTEQIKSNCLYWFSVKSEEEGIILKKLLSDNKTALWNEDKKKCRVLPARNLNNSNIIYVGVRKGSNAKKQNITNISGRFVQHLGYYKEGRTQGLQLSHFSRDLNIDITIHFYKLDSCPDEYLYILEKIFAKKLKPICGKH